MTEFWEASFQEKQAMWGSEPANSAIETAALFKKNGFKNILIPGLGYGRNAQVFTDNGFEVTGIEISETAIEIAKKHYGNKLKIYHGSVSAMPFGHELFDGIFCYALIHLLSEEERKKLVRDCFSQLKKDGYMVFVTISINDAAYGNGEEIATDQFLTKHGVNLFFYDPDSIEREFGNYGLLEVKEIAEPAKNMGNKPSQKFWQIICKK